MKRWWLPSLRFPRRCQFYGYYRWFRFLHYAPDKQGKHLDVLFSQAPTMLRNAVVSSIALRASWRAWRCQRDNNVYQRASYGWSDEPFDLHNGEPRGLRTTVALEPLFDADASSDVLLRLYLVWLRVTVDPCVKKRKLTYVDTGSIKPCLNGSCN